MLEITGRCDEAKRMIMMMMMMIMMIPPKISSRSTSQDTTKNKIEMDQTSR
jgi:hypothetical protein